MIPPFLSTWLRERKWTWFDQMGLTDRCEDPANEDFSPAERADFVAALSGDENAFWRVFPSLEGRSAELERVAHAHFERMRGLREEFQPRLKFVMDRCSEEIAAVLPEKQRQPWQVRFNEIRTALFEDSGRVHRLDNEVHHPSRGR